MHHKRGDAVLAREFTLALPHELPDVERERLAFDYGKELADRYGVAVDVALHEPDRKGDRRNYHAHVMLSACTVARDGTLGKKAVELDPIHCQRAKIDNFSERERPRFADLQNERLRAAGSNAFVDHRSLMAQGIDRVPTKHLGPAASGYERRTGKASKRRLYHEQQALEVAERLAAAAQLGAVERELEAVRRSIIDIETDLQAALRERDQRDAAMHGRAAAERSRRVAGLFRLMQSGGVSSIFATKAVEALQAAPNASEEIHWGTVEVATIRECLDVGHDPDEVIRTLKEHSPGRVDPATHAILERAIRAEVVRREAQWEQENDKRNSPRGPDMGH
jgi:hypothetical protein